MRLLRHNQAVAALSHANILAIHDFGVDLGLHFAVTELLEGQTPRHSDWIARPSRGKRRLRQ